MQAALTKFRPRWQTGLGIKPGARLPGWRSTLNRCEAAQTAHKLYVWWKPTPETYPAPTRIVGGIGDRSRL